MGLDQSFYQRKTVFTSVRESANNPESCDGTVIPWEQLGGVQHVSTKEQVGYLRKANSIHGWIVRELAGGVDECQEIYLSKDDVDHLLADIEVALADPQGNTVLPPAEGFFFGGYERDEWYIQDIQSAKVIAEWIKAAMERHADISVHESYDWLYQASW